MAAIAKDVSQLLNKSSKSPKMVVASAKDMAQLAEA